MNNLVYFGLLALVAVISAQELNPGECDPVAYAEVIRGCNSSCGDGTCKSPAGGKPYCECEKAPKLGTSDKKWECTKYYVELEEMMAGQPLLGQECRDRCPAESNLVPYVCDENDGDGLVCVCAPSESQSQVQVDSTEQGNMRVLDIGSIEDLISKLLQGLCPVLEMFLSGLKNLLDNVLDNLDKVLKNLIKGLLDLLDKLQS